MFPDRARPLPLIPVTVYEGDTIQTMYRPFQEALANRFVGDFQRFLEHSVRAETRQRFEGAALVAYRAQQAREALMAVSWGLTEAAQATFAPALELLTALEHASAPYLSERGQQLALELPVRGTGSNAGPAHPDLIDTVLTLAGQASQAMVTRAMQELVDEGEYTTTEEALAHTWTQECSYATLYRFEDSLTQYDVVFGYQSLPGKLLQSVSCYTWDYLHPQLAVIFAVESGHETTMHYGQPHGGGRVEALSARMATDLVTIFGLIRDDDQDGLHSISRSFM